MNAEAHYKHLTVYFVFDKHNRFSVAGSNGRVSFVVAEYIVPRHFDIGHGNVFKKRTASRFEVVFRKCGGNLIEIAHASYRKARTCGSRKRVEKEHYAVVRHGFGHCMLENV